MRTFTQTRVSFSELEEDRRLVTRDTPPCLGSSPDTHTLLAVLKDWFLGWFLFEGRFLGLPVAAILGIKPLLLLLPPLEQPHIRLHKPHNLYKSDMRMPARPGTDGHRSDGRISDLESAGTHAGDDSTHET